MKVVTHLTTYTGGFATCALLSDNETLAIVSMLLLSFLGVVYMIVKSSENTDRGRG